jgi:hypothetical protein
MMVCPVMIVSLLMAISKTKVKKQERNNAHDNDMPYLAPDTTMEVTLPVPITYPTINRPGIMELINCLNFLKDVISMLFYKNQNITFSYNKYADTH